MRTESFHWLSELKTVTNKVTNKKYYYIKCCDSWRRVSKRDYEARESEGNRQDCFVTQTTSTHIHHFKTVYGIHY